MRHLSQWVNGLKSRSLRYRAILVFMSFSLAWLMGPAIAPTQAISPSRINQSAISPAAIRQAAIAPDSPEFFVAPALDGLQAITDREALLAKLPPLQPHPLPPSLAQWQDAKGTGDYFDQIQPVVVGALVWSHFPIAVYIEPVTEKEQAIPFTANRAHQWIQAIQNAVQEWQAYLPLQAVEQPESADIQIWRSPLPLRLEKPSTTPGDRPTLSIPRARSAETRFEFYTRSTAIADKGIAAEGIAAEGIAAEGIAAEGIAGEWLAHHMRIFIRPDQANDYLQAAARHELGHALGIWGHSPQPTDALYFSQVRNPAPISARDINTLKKVYEQPTRLGWPIPVAPPNAVH